MKALFQSFHSKKHSWGKVQSSIERELIRRGHHIDIIPTDDIKLFPEDLKNNINLNPDNDYDFQCSYTAPQNWRRYLDSSRSKKNRFAIWAYEFPILPLGFSKNHIYVDKILATSNFNKDMYLNGGVPESKVVVVPHGIDKSEFENLGKIQLKTKKKLKLVCNIGQPHSRKGIDQTLEAYAKTFKKSDDICFVLKVSTKQIKSAFEVDTFKILKRIEEKYPNHAEIELIKDFIPNINDLYNSCDAVYHLSRAEGFGLTYLEGMAAGKVVIAPRHGGQLDFLNDNNCLFVEGKLERAPMSAQYWSGSKYNSWWTMDVDSAIIQLHNFYNNHEKIKQQLSDEMKKTVNEFTWSNSVDKILSLVEL